jgi:glycosyltransferase involved in cell wall biosynthesis
MGVQQRAATPVVSVGIPVFNGAAVIGRSIEAILAQTYGNLEIIIADNCSTDDTQSICRHYQERDRRIRYFRQPENRGATANFAFCLLQSSGEYFMWCASDDCASPNYIEACVATLEAEPATILAAGLVDYSDGSQGIVAGARMQLTDDSGVCRVIRYFRRVADNGAFYGVYRRHAIAECELRGIMGGDWLWLSEVALLGKVRTIASANLRRDNSWGNTTPREYYKRLVRIIGAPSFFARVPRTATAFSVGVAMFSHSRVFQRIPWPRRMMLSVRVVATLLARAVATVSMKQLPGLGKSVGSGGGNLN